MAEAKPRNFVVITASGRVWGGMAVKPETGYFDILSAIHLEYGSAGASWDRPATLLLNGKVVVDGKLADVAWAYGGALSKALQVAREHVQAQYTLSSEASSHG